MHDVSFWGGVKLMKEKRLNNKGFSLIELIVAVIIIAIISGGSIMAFGSVFSNKVTVACEAIQDGLKQARVDALGLENSPIAGTLKTNIYAKFYYKDSGIYIDVCSCKGGVGDDEVVLHTRKVCSDDYSLKFYENYNDTVAVKTIDDSFTGSIKVYFKKSTGGISGVEYSASDIRTKNDIIRVVGPGSANTQDVVLVSITGRSYIE